MNVYIINKGGHDYSEATKWGRIKYLSEGSFSKYTVNKIYREFALQLRESSDQDYILLTNFTTMACIACSCFAFLHGRINLLLFKNGKYIERRLLLSELLTKEMNEKEI